MLCATLAPSVAHADPYDDCESLASLLERSDASLDISHLRWDNDRARNAAKSFFDSPLHFSSMNLADIQAFTLHSLGDDAISLDIERVETERDLDALHEEAQRRIDAIGDMASRIPDERERAWMLLRVLAETVVYDKDMELSHTPYGALLEHRADCTGISCAYKLLCDASGIDCDVVSGDVIESQTGFSYMHAWNRLMIDGEELYVDVTFSLRGDLGLPIGRDWFLLSAKEMHDSGHFIKDSQAL